MIDKIKVLSGQHPHLEFSWLSYKPAESTSILKYIDTVNQVSATPWEIMKTDKGEDGDDVVILYRKKVSNAPREPMILDPF